MTPTQRGHRDAAHHGALAENPYDFKSEPEAHDAWVDAVARVNDFRLKGLDPSGHHPQMPHLCERNVTKVCNCCSSCSTACWGEGMIDRVHRVVDRIPGARLLRKVFSR